MAIDESTIRTCSTPRCSRVRTDDGDDHDVGGRRLRCHGESALGTAFFGSRRWRRRMLHAFL